MTQCPRTTDLNIRGGIQDTRCDGADHLIQKSGYFIQGVNTNIAPISGGTNSVNGAESYSITTTVHNVTNGSCAVIEEHHAGKCIYLSQLVHCRSIVKMV